MWICRLLICIVLCSRYFVYMVYILFLLLLLSLVFVCFRSTFGDRICVLLVVVCLKYTKKSAYKSRLLTHTHIKIALRNIFMPFYCRWRIEKLQNAYNKLVCAFTKFYFFRFFLLATSTLLSNTQQKPQNLSAKYILALMFVNLYTVKYILKYPKYYL